MKTINQALVRVSCAVILLLTSSGGSNAQSQPPQKKTSISVSRSGTDVVGESLAYAVREELRKSQAFNLAQEKESLFNIELISLDMDIAAKSGASSAIAVTFTMSNLRPHDSKDPQTWYPLYLRGFVLLVGRNRVDQQARSIVASLDAAIEDLKSSMPNN